MKTNNISTLKINKMTQTQYDREFENGNVEESALYLIPEIEKIGELSNLKTNNKSSIVDAINELFDLLNK
jgi:hypothetical protein